MHQYYRNFELANLYHVSQSAVGKWVEAARKGKLDLTLIEDGGKSYIAATTKNRAKIEAMVEERKKYFNNRSRKVIKPEYGFYSTYTEEQVLDIIGNLEKLGEIPLKYSYLNAGAERWDKHIKRRIAERTLNSPVLFEARQLEMNRSYIDALLSQYNQVDVIDVGPGNAFPVKDFIGFLLKNEKLHRYLAIDISPEMLELAKRNLTSWFGGGINFEADIRDIAHERFSDLLDYDGEKNKANLVLLLGGTLGNFNSPEYVLGNLYHSMNRHDLLVYSLKLDTAENRQTFDFASDGQISMSAHHRTVLELLGLDESLYSVETGFDVERSQRFLRLRLNVAVSLEFNLPRGSHRVDFKKDETILVWHYKHQTAREVIDQFESNGFNLLHASQTEDHEFLLIICDLKTER